MPLAAGGPASISAQSAGSTRSYRSIGASSARRGIATVQAARAQLRQHAPRHSKAMVALNGLAKTLTADHAPTAWRRTRRAGRRRRRLDRFSGRAQMEAWRRDKLARILHGPQSPVDEPPVRDAASVPTRPASLREFTRETQVRAAEAPVTLGRRDRLLLDVMDDVAVVLGSPSSVRCTRARLRRLERFFGVRCPAEPRTPTEWTSLPMYQQVLAGLRYGFPLAKEVDAPVCPRRSDWEACKYGSADARAQAMLYLGEMLRSNVQALLPTGSEPPAMVSPAYIIPKKSAGKFRVILDSTIKDADGFALGVNAWIAYENYGAVLMDSIEEVVRAAQAFREQHPEEPTVAMAVDWSAWFHQLPLSLRSAGEMWTRLGDRSALQLMLSMGSASSPLFACLVSTAFTRRMQERITLDGHLPIASSRVFVDD